MDKQAWMALPSRQEKPSKKCQYPKVKALLWLAMYLFLFILAFQGLWYTFASHDHAFTSLWHTSTPRSCNCGSSVAEALSRGCKYDSLAAGWLPAHCRDDELTAEFEQTGDGLDGSWTYWLDRNHTAEISIEDLAAKGDDPNFRFHMSIEWHKMHCIFYWIKEHRTRFNGKRVEGRSDSEKHIKHCGMILNGMTGPGTVAGVELNMDDVHE